MRSTPLPRRLFIKKGLVAGVYTAQGASLLIAYSALTATAQTANDYPSKPVKIVVGFPAGGGTDVFARALAQGLQAQLGGSFLVDNKPGAGGLVASQGMLQAPPDGLTLLLGSTSTQVIAPLLYAKRPYTPADFTPIAHIASVGIVLVAHPSAPYNNIAELIQYAKQRPVNSITPPAAMVSPIISQWSCSKAAQIPLSPTSPIAARRLHCKM